ncbi:hypothetical protein [Arthrobacter sp. GMC3]|uniref:hypothetical protein n=1 Tax=Arthrobacter sp. GMC3 TaxID=2058894 RepID=UPI000CE56482|nr:hypothetical protein [Arthrobacter sp. GMC3]
MKKTIAALAIVALLALTGCGSGEAPTDKERDYLHENSLKLDDGRTVTCIVRGTPTGYRGGLSCDWDGAK